LKMLHRTKIVQMCYNQEIVNPSLKYRSATDKVPQ